MIKRSIPLAAMEKIMKSAGAERVSGSAKSALKSAIEEEAEEIARSAVLLAGHAGRKTIKAADIKLAAKQ